MGIRPPVLPRPARPQTMYPETIRTSPPRRVFGVPVDASLSDIVLMFEQGEIDVHELRRAVSEHIKAQRPPKVLPETDVPQRAPNITGVRPLTHCTCGRNLLPGMRFCDACGQPVGYTGRTVKL